MDPPYIHRPRYVAVPSSNPNLFRPSPSSHVYHHHPHNNNNNNNYLPPPQHQPLPPPPPPPPQQPVPPPPPPPPTHQQLHHHRPPLSVSAPPTKNPYNSHHHLQFTYNPSFNPKSHNLDHNQHQHHHQRSHDFVHRILVDDDRQHLHRQRLLTEFDAPSDVWDPPRIVPDHRPVVNNLEHNHPFDNQPMSPYRSIEKIKHELEMNQRFRERYSNDGFEFEHKSGNCNQREFVSRRSLFVSDSDRLKSGNYDNLHGSQFDGDEIRRSHVRDRIFDRQPLRKTEIRDSMIEIGQNSTDAGGGIRGFSGKSEFYASDSGRYVNNRGSRENSYEYNRTPRKQLQKKSALLRIQKPCFRNRDNDELHYSGYYDQMKSSVFRGKDKDVYPDHGVGAEKEREGSPVELDVSFKSNSLVVNFGSAVVSDTNLTPKNGKSRNGMISDKHRSSQQMNKACNESIKSEHIKLGSSREDVNNASNSDNKDSKQSGNEVACPPISEMLDKNIQSCTNQANDSPGKITVKRSKCAVSGKGCTDVVTSKSRVKVAKKKRVVKKLVKKVMNPNVHATSLQPTENLDEPAKADDTTLNTPTAPLLKKGPKPSEEKITPPDMTSVHTVDLQPSPNKVTMSPENDKVGGLSHVAVGSEEVNADVDSGGSTITNIKRKMNNSNFFLASSIPKATGIDKGSVNADNSFGDSHNTDKDITKSPKGRIVSAIGEGEVVVKQLCHKGSTLLLENSATKESPKKLFQVGADINSDLLSSEGNKRNEGPVNTGVFADGMNVTISFNNGLVSSGEKINSSDIGTMDVSGKQPCKTQDCSAEEGFPLATLPTRINEMPTFPGSEEAEIDNVSIYADCSNHDKHSISGSDNVCVNSEGTYLGTVDCIGKQLSTSGVTVSLQKVAKKGLPNTIFSEGSEEEMPDITDEGKVMTCPSDLPDAMITDMYEGLVKAVSSAQSTNATLSFSVKESCPAAVKVTGSLDLGSQSCPNGFNVLHGSNLIGECSEALVTTNSDFIGTSPENRKRRKVSSCISGMPSQITSGITVGPVTTDLPTPAVGLPTRPNEDLIQPEGKVTISSMDTCLSSVVAASGSRNVFGIGGDDGSKIDQARADSCSTLKESCIPNAHGSCPPVFGSEQIINATPVMDGNNHSDEVMCMEGSKAEKMDAVAAEKQVTMCTEATQLKTISEHQSLELIERLAGRVMESNGYPLESYDLPSMSPHLAVAADGDGVSTTNFHDEIMELDTTVSDMGSPEILSRVPVMQSLNCEESTSQNSDDMVCGNEKMPNEKPVIEGISNLSSHTSSSQYVKNNLKSDCTLESAHLVVAGTGSLPSQDVKIAAPNLNSKNGETYGKKNQLSLAASRIHSSRSSFVFNSKKNTASSTHNTKPRTWHRTENTSSSSMPGNKSFLRAVAPQSHLPKKVAKLQGMSYIRKGNSLVRKPTPVAAFPQISHGLTSSVHQLNSSGLGELKKHTGCDSGADVIDPPNFLKTGGLHAPFERPRTPPLPTVTKVPTFTTNSSGDCTSSPLSEPPPNSCSEATSDALKSVESNNSLNSSNDTLKFSETPVNQTGLINSSESQVELNDGAFATSNVNRITYVKRKSNQLVAASNHHSSTIQKVDKTQGVTADGYYKRRKNQLIRASVEGQTNQSVNLADNDSISKGKTASKDKFGRSFSNGRSHKVVTKIHKPSRFSLVWTLKSMRSSLDNNHLLYPQKVLPSLFPWKKTAYWRRFVQNSVSITNNSSLSAISRKLLLLRNRDAVYTRSNHGFSLRKSKVFSVGGSNLKWSKSIEKRSKKANEEATLAVAAVERKKRGQNSAKSFSDTKNRSHSPRDRIFRIGSVRYRMDSSRRTLQRISDDESTCSAAVSSGKNAKNSYIPRRLVIGNDEYVRIGNGNQLIRDPKKRTRVLASEKVRWSLHTARLRLARKRKYCQFFTRFGKCNKGDGKCPYIHDPSKIAVCTKFLNGLCSNSNCKLTHKVIPERMPDCSYFLQGLCSNKDCPYRHVHVNPKASTCEGFLRGYCVDGNECRKKHSYVCPTFEATGSCPLGSKCKLHHPKSRSKGKKIRRSREQKNTRGRYFGSMSIEDLESRKLMSERHSMQDDGDICFEGRFTDYISLDVSDEEAGETNDAVNELTTFPESDASDLHFDDLDELIKPIGIMNIT